MRTIVIGDIHGGYRALEQLIGRIAPGGDDQLIFLGDYVDGWTESAEVIEWLMTAMKNKVPRVSLSRKPILLRGNHDALFEEFVNSEGINEQWLKNGGQSTLDSYSGKPTQLKEKHSRFLRKNLKDYYIDDDHRAYLHAGFTNLRGPAYEYHRETPYWDRTLWEMALAIDPDLDINHPHYPERLKLFKEIYIGHTPTAKIGKYKPVNAASVWNLDTAAAYRGPLSAIDVTTKEIWQSDPVHELYPDEEGRN